MLNFNTISTNDGFYETTFDLFAGTDLNTLPDDLIIDLIDEKFPNTRFSIDLAYLVIQLTHNLSLPNNFPSIEDCKKALETYIFALRNEGFFAYDNDVRSDGNNLSIEWSYKRKLPVATEMLLQEIQDIYMKIENKAREIIQFHQNSDASQNN